MTKNLAEEIAKEILNDILSEVKDKNLLLKKRLIHIY